MVEDRVSSFVIFSAVVLRLDLRDRRTHTPVPVPKNHRSSIRVDLRETWCKYEEFDAEVGPSRARDHPLMRFLTETSGHYDGRSGIGGPSKEYRIPMQKKRTA